MKKSVLIVALCALAAAAFAKAPKVSGWKDVAKIANKNKLEVVNDEDLWYVAKGNGGKDFALFCEKIFQDARVTLAMSCIKGEVFSKTTAVDLVDGQPEPIFVLEQGADKVRNVNADNLTIYFKDEAIAAWTNFAKEQTADILKDVAGEYGIVPPKN